MIKKLSQKHRLKEKKRMHVLVVQLHSYTHDDSQQHRNILDFLYNNSNRLDRIASSPKSMRKEHRSSTTNVIAVQLVQQNVR